MRTAREVRRLGVEESARRHTERLGNIEQSLIEQSASAMFYIDEHISCDTGLQSKGFLRHPAGDAQAADSLPDSTAVSCPRRDPLWIVLAGSRGHTN